MANTNHPTDTQRIWLEEPKKIPSLLNVLTILTFIGSGIGFIFSIVGFFNAQSNYDKVLQVQDKMDQMPAFMKSMMGSDPVGMARRQLDNRLPIMLLSLVGAALCLYGAIQMRKLKKTGFSMYVLGDLVPFAVIIFTGTGGFSSFGAIFAIVITLVFLILYATQLKYMK